MDIFNSCSSDYVNKNQQWATESRIFGDPVPIQLTCANRIQDGTSIHRAISGHIASVWPTTGEKLKIATTKKLSHLLILRSPLPMRYNCSSSLTANKWQLRHSSYMLVHVPQTYQKTTEHYDILILFLSARANVCTTTEKPMVNTVKAAKQTKYLWYK